MPLNYLAVLVALLVTNGVWMTRATAETQMADDRELIIVAAPKSGDPYYAEVADAIFTFHRAYADAVAERDDYLVLVDAGKYDRYVAALGPERVAKAPQADIWMRDFSLSNVKNPIRFRYTAAGQGGGRRGQSDADYVQNIFERLAAEAGLLFRSSRWYNDGGNWVDDYAGRVVLSRKFLRDNRTSESKARAYLQDEYGVQHVAFIEADEQGGLEHADGVVAFIAPNVLVINSYDEDPDYAADLEHDLQSALPDVTIHKIVTAYDGREIYDADFGSACGLYTNMLVTPHRIYFPQFGIPEDRVALAQIESWTDKDVIPVRSEMICMMGGGVRCMSWQLRGENANRLRAWLNNG